MLAAISLVTTVRTHTEASVEKRQFLLGVESVHSRVQPLHPRWHKESKSTP